jgi:hypothetical protein
MLQFNLMDLKLIGDERGSLIALEENSDVPFTFKRVFYIFGTQENISRGNHAHYKTKQFLVAVHGSCKVTLNNGIEKETFELNSPNLGLFQDALIWGTMHNFSEDCVLMVLADDYYREEDYIREYDNFLKIVRIKNEKE